MEVQFKKRKYSFYVIYNTIECGYVNRKNLNPEYDKIINGDTLFFKDKKICKSNCVDPHDIVQKVTFTMENIEYENK